MIEKGEPGALSDEQYLKKFDILSSNSSGFLIHMVKRISDWKIPPYKNTIFRYDNDSKIEVAKQANNSYPIAHAKLRSAIPDFLQYKKKYGTQTEQEFYKFGPPTIIPDHSYASKLSTPEVFTDRLLKKRPIVFYGPEDNYISRNVEIGAGGFESIGTQSEKGPLILNDYLSYDEMAISALVLLSSPVFFINNGKQGNQGIKTNNCQEEGIYVGLVEPRYEKYGLMEAKYIIITRDNNIVNNKYGLNPAIYGLNPTLYDEKNPLTLWKKLFTNSRYPNGLTFPTFDEAKDQVANGSTRFVPIDNNQNYFDTWAYKERMRLVIEPLLFEANSRAQQYKKVAYLHIIGPNFAPKSATELGSDVTSIEVPLMLDVYAETIRNYNIPHVSDINFSWFPFGSTCGGYKNDDMFITDDNLIKIHFSERNPADALGYRDYDKLLIVTYAANSNAYAGNEYWRGEGKTTASSACQAALSSSMATMQNPDINDKIAGIYTVYYDPEEYRAPRTTSETQPKIIGTRSGSTISASPTASITQTNLPAEKEQPQSTETKLTFTPKSWNFLDYLQNIKQRFTAYISPYTPNWLTRKRVLAGGLGLVGTGVGAYYLYSKYYGAKR
jgi:hypothetical protein